jgi:integrase
MPDFVSRALQRHPLSQGERFLSLGLSRPELVVANATGQPFQPASFSGAWRDFARAHGFESVTFHGLRHGAATLLLAAGVPDTVAMRAMGHADTRILARYQDVVSELQRDAAARMDRWGDVRWSRSGRFLREAATGVPSVEASTQDQPSSRSFDLIVGCLGAA